MKYDKIRANILEQYSITIIRFTNTQIKNNFMEVCEHIGDVIKNIRDRKQV